MTESHRPLHLRHGTVIGHWWRKGIWVVLLKTDVVGGGDRATTASTERLRVVDIAEVEGDTGRVIGFLVRSEHDVAGMGILGGKGETGVKATEGGRSGGFTADDVGFGCGLTERRSKWRSSGQVGQEERKQELREGNHGEDR